LIRVLLTACAVATLSACATASAPAQASDPTLGPPATPLKGYLAASDLDGKVILGPPPAPGSAQDQADREIFEATRSLQGSPRWRKAVQDADLWRGGAMKRFSCAMGVDVGARQTPVTYRILQRIELDARTVGTPPKDFYGRKRPLIGNDAPICVPRQAWMTTNASYPSGHSMTGWAWALVLAELKPAKADPLLAAGREMGESRVICGVHFESDVAAGRVLGSAMVARMHADPAFETDLAAAKQEMARADQAPADCDAS
jgi:acid phosphatase (class A)